MTETSSATTKITTPSRKLIRRALPPSLGRRAYRPPGYAPLPGPGQLARSFPRPGVGPEHVGYPRGLAAGTVMLRDYPRHCVHYSRKRDASAEERGHALLVGGVEDGRGG